MLQAGICLTVNQHHLLKRGVDVVLALVAFVALVALVVLLFGISSTRALGLY